jgi:ribosomal protein S17E
MKHQDEELHAQLLAEFRRYFEYNQQWLNEGTKAASIRVRNSLSEIRRICTTRRAVVREWAVEKEAELRIKQEQRVKNKQNV